MKCYIYFLLTTWMVTTVSPARILALFPYIGKSHYDVFEPYVEELASRGHQVVVLSHFPHKTPVPNLTDISLVGSLDISPINRVDFSKISGINLLGTVFRELSELYESCNKTLSFHTVQELWNSDQSFDLVIAETFNTDCIISFAHRFKAPLIGITSCVQFPWTDYRMANPHNSAYVPNVLTWFNDKMDFIERCINLIFEIVSSAVTFLVENLKTQRYVYQNLGENLPSLSEIARNTSLVLLGTHFSLTGPRPLVPGVVEVGGLHIKPPKKLPKDLEDFLSGAEHGVIYFSMGSMLRGETLPPEKRDAFLQAFSELPQRVLWKWEGDTFPGQPKNVKTMKWIPQFDVLNHPNVRVFMTHGGMLSITEAVYAGVPMVGIPMFGDQPMNVATMEAMNIGARLDYNRIDKEEVLKALRTALDTRYKENAEHLSQIYKDRPLSAMDTAIYWTEYVIRHKGAPHLRSAALDLSWYQYLLLDVIAAIFVFTLVLTVFIVFIVKKILYLCKTSAAVKMSDMKKKIK